MQNPDNRPKAQDQEKIMKVVDEIDSTNKEKKTRLLLAYEIQNMETENVFLAQKIETLQKELYRSVSEIESLNTRLTDPMEKLSGLIKEKKNTSLKIEELKMLETEYKENISLLPGLKRSVLEADKEVRKLAQTCKIIEEKWNQACREKKALEASGMVIASKLSSLETKHPALRNTRSILYGILPEGYDIKTFDEISVNFEKHIQAYYDEIDAEIVRVKEQTQVLENSLDKEKEIEKSIRPEKLAIEKEVKIILDAEGLDLAMVSAELERLRSRKQEQDIKKNMLAEGIQKTALEIADVDGFIATQQIHISTLKDRYKYLAELSHTVAKMDSVENEIKKTRTKCKKIEIEQRLSHELLGTIKNIQEDLGLTNKKLKFIYSEYNDKLEYFDQSINTLFSK